MKQLVMAAAIFAVAAPSWAANVELQEGFKAGQLELTFTGLNNGAQLDVKVKNQTATPLTLVVNRGVTTFDFGDQVITLSSASKRVLKLPASGNVSFVVGQSGRRQIRGGSMTVSQKPQRSGCV